MSERLAEVAVSARHGGFDEADPVTLSAAHERQQAVTGVQAPRCLGRRTPAGRSGAEVPCDGLPDHVAQFLISHTG